MQLYTNAHSRGNTVLPLLKELEIEDQVDIIQVDYANLNQPEYLALNPMAKLPFLVDQGSVISETPAIFAYLADKYIEKGFAPTLNDPKRGEYLKWLFFCHGPLTEFMDIKSLGVSAEQIQEKRRSLAFGTEQSVYRFIQSGLGQANPYLLGDRIFAADLFLAYWLIYAISFKIVPYLDEFKPFIQMVQKRETVKDIAWIQMI
ncbi:MULTISPECIES: glutathione S-transferase family protein [unclassified Acinetobacter]|uniref:glutathione S-transferase family protein n=1 Tax=unclassified Acinetobacter TaxID=196816 RepID=UPI0018AA8DE6|nr:MULTISPECIES: glutathione S-transferase family protein [unclassified Acinetobacter]MBJ9953658.1 glutathione S-transferase family protein [Acinetobacter baumannii]